MPANIIWGCYIIIDCTVHSSWPLLRHSLCSGFPLHGLKGLRHLLSCHDLLVQRSHIRLEVGDRLTKQMESRSEWWGMGIGMISDQCTCKQKHCISVLGAHNDRFRGPIEIRNAHQVFGERIRRCFPHFVLIVQHGNEYVIDALTRCSGSLIDIIYIHVNVLLHFL